MVIKTTIKTLTGKRKALLGFVCPECGKRQITEYEFSASEMVGIDVEDTKNKVNDKLGILDIENKNQFNNMHDYMVIKSPVKCKECFCIQAWSDMTDNPDKPTFPVPLATAAVIFAGIGVYGVIAARSIMSFILLFIGVISFLIGNAIKKNEQANYDEAKETRSENIAKFVSDGNELPIYYRIAEEDFSEIVSGPYANEFMEYVKKKNN